MEDNVVHIEADKFKHTGETVNDFLKDMILYSSNLNEEDRKVRLEEFAAFVNKHPEEVDHKLEQHSDFHNYLIEDVTYKASSGGLACGMMSGFSAGIVKFKDENKTQYLICLDACDFPYFFLKDKDISDYLLDEEIDGDEMESYFEKESLKNFEDIDLSQPEYYEIFNSLNKSKDYNASKLIRFILNIMILDGDATDALINKAKNKHISDFFVSRTFTEYRYEKNAEKE